MLNQQLLEEEINKSGLKITYICEKLGITKQAFIKKRYGEIPFKVPEIQTMAELFGWDADMVFRIFFAKKVAL